MTGHSDSDWAGCRVARKSTSGGVVMSGGPFLQGRSRTQSNVTQSSAEAELYALVRCSAELPGMRNMMRDWGADRSGVVHADSSAALAIAKSKGAGKQRHINVSSLWIREKQDVKELELRNVLGKENLADMMTKCLALSLIHI